MFTTLRKASDYRSERMNEVRRAHGVKFVVLVETDSGDFVQLFAEDQMHAVDLAKAWVDPERLGNRGASCWRVNRDGSLSDWSFRLVDWFEFMPACFWSDDRADDNEAAFHHANA